MNKEMESKVKEFFEEQQTELEQAEKKGYNNAMDQVIAFIDKTPWLSIETKEERDTLIASLKDLKHL